MFFSDDDWKSLELTLEELSDCTLEGYDNPPQYNPITVNPETSKAPDYTRLRYRKENREMVTGGTTVSTRSKQQVPASEVILDPTITTADVEDFRSQLRAKIIGQNEAVDTVCSAYRTYLAGFREKTRPIHNLLCLGPTGSGKTRLVEATAEILLGAPQHFIKIDCAEFQHSHEIAKLIGSPPGYIGHRETQPILTQENLDRYSSDKLNLGLVLFDEIEKASDSLWQLLLGILDKATLTLGDNRKVDFSKMIVFMTSNLGAREMSPDNRSIGFTASSKDINVQKIGEDAAKRKFSPEFMNRLDRVCVFNALKPDELRQVLDIELKNVQQRIYTSHSTPFIFCWTDATIEFLLKEGTSTLYGARHLKRAIEKHIVDPLSGLILSRQIDGGDTVTVDFDGAKLIFKHHYR
jgi:ATP-dependent Clp protease ATP-binding subunit ClpA